MNQLSQETHVQYINICCTLIILHEMKLCKICSLRRGTIAERSGVRVGHKIIEINGISTVEMDHSHVVDLLANTVGDVSPIIKLACH